MKNKRLMLLLAVTATWYVHGRVDLKQEPVSVEPVDNVNSEEDANEYVHKFPLHTIILNQDITTDTKLHQLDGALQDPALDINMQDSGGKTALNLATSYNADSVIINFLIDHGADVNQPDRFNETPLHYATKNNQLEVIKSLLAAGANQKFKNDTLQTPLDLARSDDAKALFDEQDAE